MIFLINSLFLPKYRFEKYRYEIDKEKIILRYGIFNEKNVVIPMGKVRYAHANQGMMLKKYNLINLTVHTFAVQYQIPYLKSDIGRTAELSITKIVQERSI